MGANRKDEVDQAMKQRDKVEGTTAGHPFTKSKKPSCKDAKKDNIRVSAMLFISEYKHVKPEKGLISSSSTASSKAKAPRVSSSYVDGIDLPPIGMKILNLKRTNIGKGMIKQ
ncbi:conserved hypothetical protein [Ricinus communis]|uniref:Uncharacterized protein n=1 Tax=Ricinus communis TaxID=3988 RepID=B9SQX0_RICCO|nr:conserved hypothetical protein [Ricinus communis]